MADSLLSFGVEKLWDLLVRESERFQGVQEQFDGLKSEVKMLRCFLEDADAKKHTSATVRNAVKDIKEIVYDAEDIIETFLLKEELSKTSGIKKHIRKFAWVIADRRGLSFDMEALSKRIATVIRNMQILSVQKVIVNERDTQSLQERQRVTRQTFSSDKEDCLVGLEKNVDPLVGYLVEEDSIQVVSITGMGGIGKTTLARQVFNHETVKSHFEGLAWVCVSQQFTREYVWQTILRKLRPEYKVSEMTEDELQEKLFQVLEQQTTLIVLDDMWREGDWDIIKPMFPPKKGWKVLLTSRNEGVGLRADPTCFTFKPDCLTPEESWTLFQRIAFPRENSTENNADKEMEEMGKHMIKHCGGLPLAVTVLGGLLASQYTLREWKRVYESIRSHIVGGTSFNDRNISSVYQILYLSFEELPIYLKHCFLYLAHFPEDYAIDVETLSYYWAAEAIPRPKGYDGATVREVAERYIEELVQRNMVISQRDTISSRFEKCQLHDTMREVCVRKAEEENFVDVVDAANSQSPCKSRRIGMQKEIDETYDPKGMMKNPKLRSLLFINVTSRGWMPSDLLFTRLQLLRALDLSYAKFKGGKLPSSIGKLIHLRYLSLFVAKVTHLPSSMRNLKQLLYLNLQVDWNSTLYMPNNVLNEMLELIYLYLPEPENIDDKVKMELGNLVNLETLVNFSTNHSSVRDLQKMTKLETLSIKFKGGCTMETLSSSLSELGHLENLTIVADSTKDKEGFVLDCVHLKQLTLCDIYKPRLPDEQHFPSHLTTLYLRLRNLEHLDITKLYYWKTEEGTVWDFSHVKRLSLNIYMIMPRPNFLKEQHFPSSHLTTLTLSFCGLEEDPMPILEKLLQLKEVSLDNESFSGKRMVCSRGGFPQLQKLLFYRLEKWEEWTVEEGSMPLLHTLTIDDCKKLKKLPDGLRFITSLKELEIVGATLEFKEKLSRGGEDFYKVEHIPHLNIFSSF